VAAGDVIAPSGAGLRSAVQRAGVRGLVQTQLPAARQSQRSPHAPLLLFNLRGRDALPFERLDGRAKVVAHQIENGPKQFVSPMTLDKADVGRMDRHFGRGQCEYEPPVARVDAT